MTRAPQAEIPTTDTSNAGFFRRYRWVLVGLVAAALVVFILAPAASSDPDGLDRVSEDEGFAEEGKEPRYEWLPDYTVPGIDDEYWSLVVAGLIGVGIVFAGTVGLGWILRQTGGRRAT